MFNAEVCYGSGLQYNTDSCGGDVKREVEDFLLDNALPSYFLGVCQDFKHFADELCMFDNVPESITRFFGLRSSSFATRHRTKSSALLSLLPQVTSRPSPVSCSCRTMTWAMAVTCSAPADGRTAQKEDHPQGGFLFAPAGTERKVNGARFGFR